MPDLFGELEILIFITCSPVGEESLFTSYNEVKAGEKSWLKPLQQGESSSLEEQEGYSVTSHCIVVFLVKGLSAFR